MFCCHLAIIPSVTNGADTTHRRLYAAKWRNEGGGLIRKILRKTNNRTTVMFRDVYENSQLTTKIC